MEHIRVIEVGPRDGLQNEPIPIPTEVKRAYLHALVEAGLQEIEVGSFVSPRWVPQMADTADLFANLPAGPKYSALVPNLKGLERALEVGVTRIAVFTAASEAFTKANINMTIAESLAVFADVIQGFRAAVPTGFVRAYISTSFECPLSGPVDPARVLEVAQSLHALGVEEIVISDTIGVAAPPEVHRLNQRLLAELPAEMLTYHLHDTRGTAIANVFAALEDGIRAFDAASGGLGGCPYAPGAGGNLATEDLVYALERAGFKTGVDLARLARVSLPVLEHFGRAPVSRAQQAVLGA